MRHRYPQPGNEDEFEEFCLRYYRQLLGRAAMTRYGKRGERQDGIDLIDQHALTPHTAIQCKNHEPNKTIPPKEIKDEVALAENSQIPIDRFIIATTAKRSTNAHNTVHKLNQRTTGSRRFLVEIHFWEDICAGLAEFGTAIADFIVYGQQSTSATLHSDSALSQYESAPSDSEDLGRYSHIETLLTDRKLEVAKHEIEKLPDANDPTLSSSDRYAILRLKAKLALEELDFDIAAQLFEEAYNAWPSRTQAKQNLVLSLELTGNHEAAFCKAVELVKDGVDSSFLLALLVRNSQSAKDIEPFSNDFEKYLGSEELNLALISKYLEWDDIPSAKTACERASAAAPNSAHVLFANGMTAHTEGMRGNPSTAYSNLKLAISAYSEALKAASREKYLGLLPEIYLNLGRVNGIIGNQTEATHAFEAAIEHSDTPELYTAPVITYYLSIQNYERARTLLNTLAAMSGETQFLRLVTDYWTSPDANKEEQIQALARFADQDKSLRSVESRFHCVHWAIQLKNLDLARSCIPNAFSETHPFQANTLRAWIELEASNENLAATLAADAIASSSRFADREELRLLATILMRIKEDAKALPILQQIARPGIFDEDCKRLLDCAERIGRHDVLLKICSELRSSGQQDNELRKLEVQLLSNYAPEKALELAEQFIKFDAVYFSAARNFIAVRLNRPTLKNDESAQPDPNNFTVREAYLVITPYIYARRFKEAIVFSYEQLRANFSSEQAHGQYCWLMLTYGERARISPRCDVVNDESAVQLTNQTTGENRWVVIEALAPNPIRNEYGLDSELAMILIGKKVDDVVDVRGPSVQVQLEKITHIQSKFAHLLQDSMANFQSRFPGAGAIQSIHLGNGPSLDLSPIIESLRERRDHVQLVWQNYKENVCPLHIVATSLGVDERHLIKGICSNQEWFLRCANTSPEEFYSAAQMTIGTTKIVLDLSAIITLQLLDAWRHLDSGGVFLVARRTINHLEEWLEKLSTIGDRNTAYSYLTSDEKLALRDVAPEQSELERQEVQQMIDATTNLCKVCDAYSIAKLDGKRRDQYFKLCGQYALESIAIANEEGAIIWTDDLFIAVIAEMDFSVKRTWTQLELKRLANAARVKASEFSRYTGLLASWKYVATVWNTDDIIAVGSLANWDVNASPFKECIQLFGAAHLRKAERYQLFVNFLRALRTSACSQFLQTPVIQASLNAIGDRSVAQRAFRYRQQIFPVDYTSEEFVRYEIAFWLSQWVG